MRFLCNWKKKSDSAVISPHFPLAVNLINNSNKQTHSWTLPYATSARVHTCFKYVCVCMRTLSFPLTINGLSILIRPHVVFKRSISAHTRTHTHIHTHTHSKHSMPGVSNHIVNHWWISLTSSSAELICPSLPFSLHSSHWVIKFLQLCAQDTALF